MKPHAVTLVFGNLYNFLAVLMLDVKWRKKSMNLIRRCTVFVSVSTKWHYFCKFTLSTYQNHFTKKWNAGFCFSIAGSFQVKIVQREKKNFIHFFFQTFFSLFFIRKNLGSKHSVFDDASKCLKIFPNPYFIALKAKRMAENTTSEQIHKKKKLQMILRFSDYVLFATHRRAYI